MSASVVPPREDRNSFVLKMRNVPRTGLVRQVVGSKIIWSVCDVSLATRFSSKREPQRLLDGHEFGAPSNCFFVATIRRLRKARR